MPYSGSIQDPLWQLNAGLYPMTNIGMKLSQFPRLISNFLATKLCLLIFLGDPLMAHTLLVL